MALRAKLKLLRVSSSASEVNLLSNIYTTNYTSIMILESGVDTQHHISTSSLNDSFYGYCTYV